MALYAVGFHITLIYGGVLMNFKSKFLEHYLAFGIGSFSKRDIDVLILHLLDEEGDSKDSQPLKWMMNQQVSLIGGCLA